MARSSYMASVTLDRNSSWSEMTTQPTFSVAPALYSGTKTWSYLVEREVAAEQPGIEVQALRGDRRARPRRPGARRARRGRPGPSGISWPPGVECGVADDVVLARHDGGEIAGDRRRRREMPDGAAASRWPDGSGWRGLVRQHGPVRGHGDVKGERGLQVRLLEVGEDAPRVGGLELRVEVHLAVGRVDRTVQPGAVARVTTVRDDAQLVAAGRSGQRDPPGRAATAGSMRAPFRVISRTCSATRSI